MLARLGWFTALCLLMAAAGCALRKGPTTVPIEHELIRDQLVIYTDFNLPSKHRLVDDLAAQRHEINNVLGLPVSNEPVYIYLFDSADRFDGFLVEHFPNFPARRAFFVETDTRLTVYAHWGDRVAEDLRHEVSHGYMHAVLRNLPLWLDEGLAEYFEVERAMRGFNQPHAEMLVEEYRSGSWQPDMARLETLLHSHQMSQRDYAESWAWVYWLLESSPKRRHLLRNHLARLRMTGTAPPLAQVLHAAEPHASHRLIAMLQASQQPK